jgi:hypothetical protein
MTAPRIDDAPLAEKRETFVPASSANTKQAADPAIAQTKAATIAAGQASAFAAADGKTTARPGSESQATAADSSITAASLVQSIASGETGDSADSAPDLTNDKQKAMPAMAAPNAPSPQAVSAWANALAASDAPALPQAGAPAPLISAPTNTPPAQPINPPIAMSPNAVPYDSGFIDRIGQEIAILAKGAGSIRLQIMPENMGRIDIELQNDMAWTVSV